MSKDKLKFEDAAGIKFTLELKGGYVLATRKLKGGSKQTIKLSALWWHQTFDRMRSVD